MRHALETVTSCCKLQAARVWFRPALKGRPSRPPSRPAHGTNVNTLPVQGRVSQSLAASLHSKDQATNCQVQSSNPHRSPGLPFMPQVQTFQMRHALETVTSCCKLQAAGVWFRTTLKGRPSRPPSRPAHGTTVNTRPVQGRVSQRLAASLHSKDQATNCQTQSSNPNRSPGLSFMPHVQNVRTRHAPETVTSCCKLQAARVWFRPALKGRPSWPPSRPAHGTNVNTLSVQGRVSQSLAASLHSKDQATNCQVQSSNPHRSPGLPFMPQVQTFQMRHAFASGRCLVQNHPKGQTLSAPKSTGTWYNREHTASTRKGLTTLGCFTSQQRPSHQLPNPIKQPQPISWPFFHATRAKRQNKACP